MALARAPAPIPGHHIMNLLWSRCTKHVRHLRWDTCRKQGKRMNLLKSSGADMCSFILLLAWSHVCLCLCLSWRGCTLCCENASIWQAGCEEGAARSQLISKPARISWSLGLFSSMYAICQFLYSTLIVKCFCLPMHAAISLWHTLQPTCSPILPFYAKPDINSVISVATAACSVL